MATRLDLSGLSYLWDKIKAKFATKDVATTSDAGLMSASDKAKLDGIAAGAQVNSITGVKGNVESSYRQGNVNLTPSNIGALPLAGGTLTGDLIRKANDVDASKADNGITSTKYPTTFAIKDSANRILTTLEAAIYANGKIDANWYVRNYNTNGGQVGQKGIRLSMDKTGALTYTFSDPHKARSALGVTPANIGAVSASDIANDLTTTAAGKVLDARQGKALKDTLDVIVLAPSSSIPIPASGSSAGYDLAGLTSTHELVRWNFSASAENAPPVNLSWSTYNGYFTITNGGGTTSESMRPVFALPQAVVITSH